MNRSPINRKLTRPFLLLASLLLCFVTTTGVSAQNPAPEQKPEQNKEESDPFAPQAAPPLPAAIAAAMPTG